MKGIIAWFAENHVAANLLMIFFLLAGAFTAMTMKLEVFPETSLDRISITIEYSGASPAEVEEALICRIEESIAGLAGIKRIDSVAREGFATVTIEVMKDWDLKELLDEVKAEVYRITAFPDEAEKPVVREVTRRIQVINIAVYGDVSESTLKHLAEKIKNDIINLPGITLAELLGMRKREIHIELSEKTLGRYGLTLDQVAEIVKESSLDIPAGKIKTSGGEILVRTKGRRYFAKDYNDVAVITRPDGSKVTIGKIATLKDGFEDVDVRVLFQNKPAAVIQVFRVSDQNALSVAATVRKYIEEIRPSLPAGVDIASFSDRSKVLRSRIELLLKNMGLGFLLVSVMLALFLDIRPAFWVTLGIPVSFMAGLMALPHFDVSLNMTSLFAFIMVLGIVVDDAIIIGENIFRKQEGGLSPLKGAIQGATGVSSPVIFSVLTTMVAFWPMLLGTGTMGNLFRSVPIVVILVLFGSLVESLLILPAHLARGKKEGFRRQTAPKKEKAIARWLKWVIHGPYARLVDFCLRWRYATVALGIAILLLSLGMWKGGWMKFTFLPKVEGDVLRCSFTMPSGTPVERTVEVIKELDQAARQIMAEADKKRPKGVPPLFEHSGALIGFRMADMGSSVETGGHLGQIWIQVLEAEKRDVSTMKLAGAWRKKVGPLPDVDSITFKSELHSAGNAIEVDLSLTDYDELLAVVDELKAELKTFPGVFDVNDSFLPGKEEMQLKLKPVARSTGLTLNDLARQVRHAFHGAEALRLQRDGDEIKVLVRYPESERRSLDFVQEMRIRTPQGVEVPFSHVALVKMEQGYVSIQRAQRRRVIKVAADVDETVTNANDVRSALESRVLPELKYRYPGLRCTIEGEGKEQKESMSDVIRGAAMAFFCIYALLAIPFKSFTQPFVVMAAIPFGLVGALLGHLIMGLNISLLSLFGMVGLAGVVVNDSLVLIYTTNRIRGQGTDTYGAVTQACTQRFRAVVLTSLTTFAGLTPMIMERSLQAQFLIPMAVSLGFGILFATVITLVLVPCGYIILHDAYDLLASLKAKLGHRFLS
ncbi:efflux RND transporter permease subunit [bacterium]|nr:efflux RND transporter permease subunit [bacterium]